MRPHASRGSCRKGGGAVGLARDWAGAHTAHARAAGAAKVTIDSLIRWGGGRRGVGTEEAPAVVELGRLHDQRHHVLMQLLPRQPLHLGYHQRTEPLGLVTRRHRDGRAARVGGGRAGRRLPDVKARDLGKCRVLLRLPRLPLPPDARQARAESEAEGERRAGAGRRVGAALTCVLMVALGRRTATRHVSAEFGQRVGRKAHRGEAGGAAKGFVVVYQLLLRCCNDSQTNLETAAVAV
eukprot:scaffold7223_cov84-Isochrysis_galbana.AAC.3